MSSACSILGLLRLNYTVQELGFRRPVPSPWQPVGVGAALAHLKRVGRYIKESLLADIQATIKGRSGR